MFEGDNLATAVGVPLFYGICEAVMLAVFCLGAWKAGWTKAPKDENICVVIGKSYEVEESILEDPNAIEIVLGTDKDGMPTDLIFSTTEEGYQIDEESLESLSPSQDHDSSRSIDEGGTEETETVNDASTISTLEEEDKHEGLTPVPEAKPDKRRLRRKGSHYSSIGGDSPMTAERSTVQSPPDALSAPPLAPLESDHKTVSSPGSKRLGHAVASMRSRAGKGKRYTKAEVDTSVGDTVAEEDDDEEQNFNFPSLSPALSRELPVRTGEHVPIPAEDKTID